MKVNNLILPGQSGGVMGASLCTVEVQMKIVLPEMANVAESVQAAERGGI